MAFSVRKIYQTLCLEKFTCSAVFIRCPDVTDWPCPGFRLAESVLAPSLPSFDPSRGELPDQRQVTVAQLTVLPEDWWNHLRDWLELETGMELSGSRSSRLREAVVNVVRKQRISSRLFTDKIEYGRFVEYVAAELTVGESFFLRNEHHMQILKETILPRILEENRERKEIRIWSAGCACGEEPYSLAILLHEWPALRSWQLSILGTDLNPAFLEKARVGHYRPWSFRQTRIQHDARFFTRTEEGYQVQEHLRQSVRFHNLNLVKEIYPSGLNGTLGLDLILFRNVAIYLKPEVTAAILKRMFQALRPGGWLLLGEIEVSQAPQTGFETHRFANVTIHRKPLTASISVPTLKRAVADPWTEVFQIHSPPLLLPEKRVSASEGSELESHFSQAVARSTGATPVPTEAETRLGIVPVIDGISPARDGESVPGSPVQPVLAPRSRESVQHAIQRLRQARTFLQLAEAAPAREQLELAMVDDPFQIEAYLLLGGLDEDAGNLRRAEQSYRRALYLDRECALVHFHLGLVLQQQGHLDQGWQSLKTALALAEKHGPDELVEHGDGVCYGRLREMVLMLTGDLDD